MHRSFNFSQISFEHIKLIRDKKILEKVSSISTLIWKLNYVANCTNTCLTMRFTWRARTDIWTDKRCNSVKSKILKARPIWKTIFSFATFVSLVFVNASYRLAIRRIAILMSKRDKCGQPCQLFAQQLTFPWSTNSLRAPDTDVIVSFFFFLFDGSWWRKISMRLTLLHRQRSRKILRS